MLIQCTKKLQERLKIKPEPRTEDNSFFSWHANLLTINRRQTVVLMNDKTRFALVLYGLKAKDFSKFNERIVEALREMLGYEGFREELIEQYLQEAGEITYTKTKDRTHVAQLNRLTLDTEFFSYHMGIVEGNNIELGAKLNRLLVGKNYVYPNRELYQAFSTHYGNELFDVKAVEMKVTLQLEGHQVYRNLIVPLNRTFTQLHDILQTAFAWTDSHLYEFYLLDSHSPGSKINWNHPAYTVEGYKPALHLVSSEEAFDYAGDEEIKMLQGIKLSAYLPEYKALTYHYDFGDSWRHVIEVIRVIDLDDKNHPVCIEGAGTAPPEDVGGEPGYSEFLRVMADQDDPLHSEIQHWVITQGYREFDLDEINRWLEDR